MKRPGKAKPFSRLTFVIATMSLVSLSSSWQAARTAELGVNQSDAVVDSSGYLKVPADYRKIYQYLGSWAIAASQGQGSDQLHNVYASPGTIDNYRATGRFPDGAVLVKEVFGTSTSAHDDRDREPRADAKRLVRHGEGQQELEARQQALGRWLGLVLVWRFEPIEDDDSRLQSSLSRMSHSGPGIRLDLRRRIPGLEAIIERASSVCHSGRSRNATSGPGRALLV